MLTTLDRYVMRQVVTMSLAILAMGLAVVMLERLLALMHLVGNPSKLLNYIGQMLVMLTPHYLALVLPAAFFLGVLLTISRLNRDSELVVLFAAGKGLTRLLRPVMLLAAIIMVITIVITGYVTPHARYGYRALKHTVTHAFLSAGIKAGAFVHFDGLTVYADGTVARDKQVRFSKVFIRKESPTGRAATLTAKTGVVSQLADNTGLALILRDGVRADNRRDGDASDGTMTFAEFRWPILAPEDLYYGARGNDRRELTLSELWVARKNPPAKPSLAEIESELNARLVIIASIPILPLLAASVALGWARGGRDYGILFGLIILVAYQKVISFGDARASRDILSPWFALWLPFGLFSLGSLYLFFRAAFRLHKWGWWDQFIDQILETVTRVARAIARKAGLA